MFQTCGRCIRPLSITCWLGGALVLALADGCGEPLPELGQVSGVVTMNGKPLPMVQVKFSPDPSSGEAAKSSKGLTDENGAYTLTYYSPKSNSVVPGAAIGKHMVSLRDIQHTESRDNPIPYRFSLGLTRAATSPFRETVVAGEQTLDFDISKYKKRR